MGESDLDRLCGMLGQVQAFVGTLLARAAPRHRPELKRLREIVFGAQRSHDELWRLVVLEGRRRKAGRAAV